jgi:hypothetical protein
MEQQNLNITVTNKKVIDFYNKHVNIDINVMNEILVDTLETIISTMSDQVNTTMMTTILTTLTENTYKQELSIKQNQLLYENLNSRVTQYVDTVKDELSHVKDILNRVSTDVTTTITLKLHEVKQSYINDMKDILNKNDSDIYNKLLPILEKNTSQLIDKTSSILTKIIPQSQDEYYKHINSQIDNSLKNFQNSIKLDNYQLLTDILNKNSNLDVKLTDFIHHIDTKFSDLIINIQNPVTQYITSSEDRLNNKLESISELSITMNNSQTKMTEDISDFLNKFRTSSNKGQYGEGLLYNILTQMYPSGEIVDTTTDGTKRGDFILKRLNRPSILIENKDYNRNVNNDEVNKFIRDANNSDLDAVFFSQKAGICMKPNWFIEIYNNKVRLYVHNVNYSSEIIKMAIDIIDTISHHLTQYSSSDEESLSPITDELLQIINNEIRQFIDKKNSIVALMNEQHKLLTDKMMDLIISPTLLNILDIKYSTKSQSDPYSCNICNNWSGRNAAALSAHKRGCKKKVVTETKKIVKEETTSVTTISDTDNTHRENEIKEETTSVIESDNIETTSIIESINEYLTVTETKKNTRKKKENSK